MNLHYLTKGGVSPRDKSRIYLMGGGDHRETVGEWLFLREDVALWFDGAEADPTPDEMEALSEMQLFVFPVTEKTLDPGGRVRRVEFPFAEERRIPVLPILLEATAEEAWAEAFGNLQWLSPEGGDDGIPFSDKLRSYLDDVLVTDGTRQRIRAAFDAYVFLSYRKKDRALAAELQRLIHRDERFRDVAIWYDEFLVPGEDWSVAIDEALERSRLFALAVTPSILEEGNFVKDVEYPAALALGKPIVAAVMAKTDEEALAASFPHLPAPVPARSAALPEALLRALEGIALLENDKDPVHNFFIGLAYLGGIDVEKDPHYAQTLIRRAAEGGVTEAMRKLVAMYRHGDGVERDWDRAVEWQERLADAMCLEYEKAPSEDAADAAAEELEVLVDLENSTTKNDKTHRVTERLFAFVRHAAQAFPSETLRYRCGAAGMLYGSSLYIMRRKEEGRAAFAYALSVLEDCQSTVPVCLMRGKIHFQIATADYYDKLRDSSRHHYEKTLAALGDIAPADGTDKVLRLRANTLERLGRMDAEEGKEAYVERLAEARRIHESLVATERVGALQDYAIHLELSAKVARQMEDGGAAERFFAENVAVLRTVKEKTGAARDLYHYGLGLFTLADYKTGEEKLRILKEALEVFLLCRRKNQERASIAGWVCFTADRLGELLREKGDVALAKAAYLEAVDAAPVADGGKLAAQSEKYYYSNLIFGDLAELCEENGEYTEALSWHDRILSAVPTRGDENCSAEDLVSRAKILCFMARLFQRIGAEERGMAAVEDAIALAECAYEEGEDEEKDEAAEALASAHETAGELFLEAEKRSDAYGAHRRALALREMLCRNRATDARLEMLRNSHRALAALCREGSIERDEYGDAYLSYDVKQAQSHEDFHAAAVGYLRLARSSRRMKEFISRARDLWKRAEALAPANPDYPRFVLKMEDILADL